MNIQACRDAQFTDYSCVRSDGLMMVVEIVLVVVVSGDDDGVFWAGSYFRLASALQQAVG